MVFERITAAWHLALMTNAAGAVLGPGKYSVIGPRKVTRLGWTSRPGSGDYAGPNGNEPAKQRFVVDSNSGRVQIYLDDSTDIPDKEDSNYVDYPTSRHHPSAAADDCSRRQ